MSTVMQRVQSLPDRGPEILLVIVHLLLPVGLWIAWRVGRPRYFGLALYIVAAVLITDVVFILGRTALQDPVKTLDRALDIRVALLFALSSVTVLALSGPNALFFICITGTLTVVSLRAFALDDETRSTRLDLALVIGMTALVICSQVFTVGYYLNVADTVNHTTAAMILRDAGFLDALSESRYYRFSAYHIYSAVGMNLSGLRPRTLTALLILGLFQVALLGTYLLFRSLSESRPLGLIGVVLMSVNIAFLHYGTISHYQSLSYVFFCTFLFILFRPSSGIRDIVVATLLGLVWVVTHHVSVLMALTLTGVPVIYLTVRSAFKGADRDQLLIISLFTVFGAMFTSYWVIVTGRFTEVIGWVLFSSPAASGLQSSSYLVSRYGDIQELTLQSVPFFLDSFHYAFLLAMTATGLTMLWRSGQLSRLRWRIVVIGAAPAAVLYFPNPLWLPLEGLLELSRWRLMLLPFLLLLPAVGLRYGMRGGRGGRLTTRRVLTVVLTAGLLFTTVTSGVSHGSITDVANLQKEPQEYLTNEELAATEFVYAHLDDDEDVHSRSDLDTYMEEYAIPRGYPYPESRFKTLTASARTNHVLVEPGLTVMSVGAFEREGVRVDIVELDPSQYPEGASVNTPIFSSTHSWDRTAGSVVYSSGAVVIQHRHRDQANESTAVR